MNLVEYTLRQRASFDEVGLGALDAAVFTQLCMMNVGASVPNARIAAEPPQGWRAQLADKSHALLTRPTKLRDLFCAENFDGMFLGLTPETDYQLLAAAAASPRFRDVEVRDYYALTNEVERVQFAAVSFVWPASNPFAFMAFRGTDTSLVGWRENFDMALTPPTPGQLMSRVYAETCANHLSQPLYFGGHSKGGNLATYAALTVADSVQQRLVRVYDLDGPGFKPNFIDDATFERIAPKVCRLVPPDSVVGMLMYTPFDPQVVASEGKGVSQHSPYLWHIPDDMSGFELADGLSSTAQTAHAVLNSWMANMSDAELPQVFDALFDALDAAGVQDASEIFSDTAHMSQLVLDAARNSAPETRDMLLRWAVDLGKLTVVHSLTKH